MFQKLYKKIDDAENCIVRKISGEISYLKHLINQNRTSVNQLKYTIEVQRQTIELLTNALQDKYERGLFIVSDERNGFIPTIIQDGKVLTDDQVTYTSVSWDAAEPPNIEINRQTR